MIFNTSIALISATVLSQVAFGGRASQPNRVQTVTGLDGTEIVILPNEPAEPEPADFSSPVMLGDTVKDNNPYAYWGEGECRQRDNTYGLNFMTNFYSMKPWKNYVNQATNSCLDLCLKYSWCYAAQLALVDGWDTPYCTLVTDRPAYEKVYGPNQDYTWSKNVKIDGVNYMTLCGNGADQICLPTNDVSSHWNGGKLHPRKSYYCYARTSSNLSGQNQAPQLREPSQAVSGGKDPRGQVGSYPVTKECYHELSVKIEGIYDCDDLKKLSLPSCMIVMGVDQDAYKTDLWQECGDDGKKNMKNIWQPCYDDLENCPQSSASSPVSDPRVDEESYSNTVRRDSVTYKPKAVESTPSLVRTVSPLEYFLIQLKAVNKKDRLCFAAVAQAMSRISGCQDLRRAISYESPCVSESVTDVETFESLADMACNTEGADNFATMCRDNSFPTSAWWSPECWGLNCESDSD